MNIPVVAPLLCAGLFFGMIFSALAGYRLGRRRFERDPQATLDGTGPIDAAIFALLGLLIAFTFSGAYGRFDARRQLIVDEVNAIGTAYLRIDLLPSDAQPAMRDKFRAYTELRLELWNKLDDREAALAEFQKGVDLQNAIWSEAVAAATGPEHQSARMLLLPALNEMIDITTTRINAVQTHPPPLIFATLILMAIVCAGLTGYSMGKARVFQTLHVVGFALVATFTVYVIFDVEFPRYGFVRLDTPHELFTTLRESMK